MEYIIGVPSPDTPTIYHHGVKGMKWGVRKKPVSTGKHPVKKVSKKTPSMMKKAYEGDKKSVHSASDDELTAYAKRMELEKRVLTLQAEMTKLTASPKKVSAGRQFVDSLWKNGVQPGINDAVKQTTTQIAKSLVDSAMKKIKEQRQS